MNKLLSKSCALVLSTSLVILSGISRIQANADTVNYVAFGDSIAYGYGLENIQDGFVYLVDDYLNTEVYNYAVNGLNSIELVEMLGTGEYDEDIINADVITLSIGSNDVLGPFTDMIYTSLGLEGDLTTGLQDWYNNSSMLKKLSDLNNLKATISNDTILDTACENFKENTFPTIISDIKELNPDCEIIVTEFYNPYYNINIGGVFDLGGIVDGYIQKLNSALDTSSIDYTIAPIYESFNVTGLTNADMSTFNMDPHPNIDGHKIIANSVIANLKTEPSDIGTSGIGTSEDSLLIGDVNKDNIVNVSDLLLFKKYMLGILSNDETLNLNLDVNNDISVNILDILTLKQILI